MKARKSWREKLDGVPEAKIIPIPPQMVKRHGYGTMLIVRGRDVEAVIKKVPRGKLITPPVIAIRLARAAGTNIANLVVIGIFIRITAEAAVEDMRAGKSRIAPYWRVVRPDGTLYEKFPGGPAVQADHLAAEGHRVDFQSRLRVVDFEGAVVKA
jgi:hypothetical protein